MECTKCRRENPEGGRYCNFCGSPLDGLDSPERERSQETPLHGRVRLLGHPTWILEYLYAWFLESEPRQEIPQVWGMKLLGHLTWILGSLFALAPAGLIFMGLASGGGGFDDSLLPLIWFSLFLAVLAFLGPLAVRYEVDRLIRRPFVTGGLAVVTPLALSAGFTYQDVGALVIAAVPATLLFLVSSFLFRWREHP